jgi:hypothetical protein
MNPKNGCSVLGTHASWEKTTEDNLIGPPREQHSLLLLLPWYLCHCQNK